MHGFANPARFLRIARWLTPALLEDYIPA